MAGLLGPAGHGLKPGVTAESPLPRTAVAGYALGSLGAGVYSTVPTVLLLYFCTEVLAIAPAVAAAILFVPKAWSIVWDPAVGAWSDARRLPHARRADLLLAGALGVTVGFPLLFSVPALGAGATALYMGLAYFALATAYSVFAVPYSTVPAEIRADRLERERLLTWRMAFAMTGVLIGAGVAPHLVELGGGGRAGYAAMSVSVALACGAAMLLAWTVVRRRDLPVDPRVPVARLMPGVARVLRHRDYLRLWLCYLSATSGVAMFLALSPYVVTRVLGRGEGDAGTALFVLLAGTVLATPLWGLALRRWDGWRLFLVATVAFVAATATFSLVGTGTSFTASLPLYFALGVPFAGLQLLPFTLLAHLAHGAATDGLRSEGLFTGLWTAGEKLALALGPAAARLGLAAVGYHAGAATQSGEATSGLLRLVVFGPALLMLPRLLMIATRSRPVTSRPTS